MPNYRCFDIGGSGIKTASYSSDTGTLGPVTHLVLAPPGAPPGMEYHDAFLHYLKTQIPTYEAEINTPNHIIYISLAGVVGYVDGRGPVVFDDWKGGILPRSKTEWPVDKREYGYSLRSLFGVKDKPTVRLYAISDTVSHGIGNRTVLEKATPEEYCMITLGTGVSVTFFKKIAGVYGAVSCYDPNPLLSLDNFKLVFNRQQLDSSDPYFKNDPRLVSKEIWSFLGYGNYEEGIPGLQGLKETRAEPEYKNVVTKRLQCLISFIHEFARVKQLPGFNIYIAGGGQNFVNFPCLGGNVFKSSENTAFNGIQYILRHDASGEKGRLPNSGLFVRAAHYPADIGVGGGSASRKRRTRRLRRRKNRNTFRRKN